MNTAKSNRDYSLHLPNDFQCPTNLLQRVYEQQVALEDMFTRDMTLYGTIRVNNCSFDKRVFVRFTFDQWKSWSTIETCYSTHYSDNNTDVFQFKLTIPKEKFSSSKNLSFVICYHVNRHEFWDNNYTRNYTLDIKERESSSILRNDLSHQRLARDYHAISNTSQQAGNLCGLKNLQGTCYMNSILQSLSFTSLLTNYFFSNEFNSKEIIAKEYFNLLSLLCSEKYGCITPGPFKQILGHIRKDYLKHEQQDAHEFLIVLLDYLNRVNPTENNNKSIIEDLFYGTYRSTTTCLECMSPSYTHEPFICLTLPIPSINECTLEDCLRYFNTEEYLGDESQWFCTECNHLCNAKRRLEIYKLPKILIIQLKRFQLDFDMNWIKNNTLVYYPENNLHLDEKSFYTLYSVVNHDGSLNDGHYTTFSRDLTLNSNLWFECDDDTIKYLPTEKLHSNSKAYLLFYMIKSTSE